MADQFIAASITNKGGNIRIIAVDNKGALWALWTTEAKVFSGTPSGVWKNAPTTIPAHP